MTKKERSAVKEGNSIQPQADWKQVWDSSLDDLSPADTDTDTATVTESKPEPKAKAKPAEQKPA